MLPYVLHIYLSLVAIHQLCILLLKYSCLIVEDMIVSLLSDIEQETQ